MSGESQYLTGGRKPGAVVDAILVSGGDDVFLPFGADNDGVIGLRSAILAANTALTGVLVGTPVARALAANSMMLSNITANGDIALYGNLGGNSQQFFFYDTSAARLYLHGCDVSIGNNLNLGFTNAAGSNAIYAYIYLDGSNNLNIASGGGILKIGLATMSFLAASTISCVNQGSGNNTAGLALSLQAGAAGTLAGGVAAGGSLYLISGAAGGDTGNGNGGDISITLGAKVNSGRLGQFIFTNLPAADPGVSGALYYVAATGVVMRSA